jgi:transposase-like protein
MDVGALRKQIDGERRGRSRPRRYSAALRSRVVDHVRSQRACGEGLPALASALGLSRYTIRAWVRSSRRSAGAFHRVKIEAAAAPVTLVAPGGYRLEGDAASVAAVLRALGS